MTLGRFSWYTFLLLAAVYCCITAYPRYLFSGVHRYGNIDFYSREPVSESFPLFIKAQEISGSGDFSDPSRTFEVYLTGGKGEYLFFAPFCRGRRSCVHPVSGRIFIAPSDLAEGTVYGLGADPAPRFLSSVIVHELMKAQLRNKLGFIKYVFLQGWKKNGYAEHVAKETAAMPAFSICGERPDDDLTGYLEDRLMVELLAEEDGESYPSMMEKSHPAEILRDRLLKKHCAGR